jgi:hypothetical protein
LPPGHDQTSQELSALIRSPQFQQVCYWLTPTFYLPQAVQSLNAALQSGELGPLLQQFGLDPSIATSSEDRVLVLLRAIRSRQQQGDSMDES